MSGPACTAACQRHKPCDAVVAAAPLLPAASRRLANPARGWPAAPARVLPTTCLRTPLHLLLRRWDVKWTVNTCEFEDFNGYADAADQELTRRGVNLGAYPFKVYFLPPNACAWVGLGYIGCDGSYDCRAWVSGGHWGNPQVGEQGHTTAHAPPVRRQRVALAPALAGAGAARSSCAALLPL